MLNLLSDETRRDPYPLYDQIRSASPVLHIPPLDMWALFDYESVKRALQDHETFSSAIETPTRKSPDWLIFADPPRHTKLRSIILRAFTPRSIALLEPRIRELSRALLAPHTARGEMDLVADYAALLPTLVIAEMMGIPEADQAKLIRWGEAIMGLSYTITGGEENRRAVEVYMAARAEMATYVAEAAERRRSAPADDLISRLVHAEVDGERLTDEEMLGFFVLLLSAGTETTTSLISNAVVCFSEAPEQLARLRAKPELLPTAIEEVLRYRSPASAMFRMTTREVTLRGQVIPARKFVLPMIGAANRDPAHFEAPGRFDVGRDPNPHIAFGHGIHFCLGASLSRLEAKVALPDLLEELPGLRLASDSPWVPRAALNVHGPARLPVRFEAREPVAKV